MKKISRHIPIVLLLALMSCASNVRTKKYTNDDFSEFKTFAYLPNTSLDAKAYKSTLDKSVETSLIETMNNKMVEKGYALDNNNPDLLIILTTSNDIESNLRNRNKYTQTPNQIESRGSDSPNFATVTTTDYQNYSSQGDAAITNRPYKEGSLVVEVFDKNSKELVWIGIAENYKAHISDQTLMSRMISEVFKEFPN